MHSEFPLSSLFEEIGIYYKYLNIIHNFEKKTSYYPSQNLQAKHSFKKKSPQDTGRTSKVYFGTIILLGLCIYRNTVPLSLPPPAQCFSLIYQSQHRLRQLILSQKKLQCRKLLGNTLFWSAFPLLPVCSTLQCSGIE